MLFLVLLNIALTLFFALTIKSFAVRVFLVVNYLVFVNPFVVEVLFDVTHPLHVPESDTYRIALGFVAAFTLVFCLSYMAWVRLMPHSRILARTIGQEKINRFENLPSVLLMAGTLTALAVGAKLVLDAFGAFRMLDEAESSPFLQFVKILATFDILVLIFLGEFRATARSGRTAVNVIFFLTALISVYFALASGSRFQTATVLIITAYAYRDVIRKHAVVTGITATALVPLVFSLFPFLSYYRTARYDLDEALARYTEAGHSAVATMLEVLATRLNYMETLAYAMDYVQTHGPAGGMVYLNNFIGLVPRLLWPDKPLISNDSQELGHMLGIVTRDDTSTSIGLREIGEAFFEFGWWGVVVAVVIALMFAFLQKNFYRPESRLAMTLYFYLTVYLVSRDGYFAVLPGLVWMAIAFVLFFLVAHLVVQYRRPRRRAHVGFPVPPGELRERLRR